MGRIPIANLEDFEKELHKDLEEALGYMLGCKCTVIKAEHEKETKKWWQFWKKEGENE